MATYLVTGAQGFLGRYLVAHLLASDPAAVVVGLGRSARNDATFTHQILLGNQTVATALTRKLRAVGENARYSYEVADLRQLAPMIAVLRRVRPQAVYHLAAGLRDDAVETLFQTNVVGSVRLIEAIAAAQVGEPRLVFASSGGVYGIPPAGSLPLVEGAACVPNDLYSISKLSAEYALSLMFRPARIPLVIGRVFNVLGPGQDERHVCGRIISQLAANLAGVGTNAVQVGALETTRDFIDVRDAVAGLVAIGQRGAPGEIYNVASGNETSIAEVLRHSLELAELDGKSEVRRIASRPADIPRHFGCISRLSAVGHKNRYTLGASLTSMLEYYRQCWSEHLSQRAAR